MNIEVERLLPGIRILCIHNDVIFASKKNVLLKSKDFGLSWEPCFEFNSLYNDISSRYLDRIFRFGITSMKVINNDGYLVFHNKNLYKIDKNFSDIYRTEIPMRSYQLMQNSICICNNYIYYGEYINNFLQKDIYIYRSKNGINWEKIYCFKKGEVKHIHSIQYDEFSKLLWISTGDKNKESLIATTDYNFSNVNIVGRGDQKWRTTHLLFYENNIIWGSDNPCNTNYIYSYDRKTGILSKGTAIPGPIYDILTIDDILIVLTASELKNQMAHIIIINNTLNNFYMFEKQYKHDRLPKIFGFGRWICSGLTNSKIFLYGQALEGFDDCSIIVNFNK